MKPKRAIIFSHGGGELANQLWGYMSVFAYAKERGYEISNPSFYEYASFFDTINTKEKRGFIAETFFFKPLANTTSRKSSLKKRFFRSLYGSYERSVRLFHGGSIVSTEVAKNQHDVYLLPPSMKADDDLASLEQKLREKGGSIYFDGWLFRNRIGIEKYRKEIQAYFAPRRDITDAIVKRMTPLREHYEHIVGVHMRQGDYRTWQSGAYYIDRARMKEIMGEYLKEKNLDAATTCFIITSDEAIDADFFKDYNVDIKPGFAALDLFTLSACDAVIGSDSTFGNFAAYYGNVPHIVAKKALIDWHYYVGKTTYFPNKYCFWVHY